MPAWALLALKLLLPIILSDLVKWGVMDAAQAAAIQTYEDFRNWLKSLKTYSKPSDFPQQKERSGWDDSALITPNNINKD